MTVRSVVGCVVARHETRQLCSSFRRLHSTQGTKKGSGKMANLECLVSFLNEQAGCSSKNSPVGET